MIISHTLKHGELCVKQWSAGNFTRNESEGMVNSDGHGLSSIVVFVYFMSSKHFTS